MQQIKNKPFFCSWSGGKDSCLALYHAIQNGGIPKFLFTMMREDGIKSRSHGLPVSILQQQSQALGIPLVMCGSSWNDYEHLFIKNIRRFKEQGIDYGVFGDIDLDPHLQWVERVCSSVEIKACEPLWKKPRRVLLNNFLNLRFSATVVVVKQGPLDSSYLGRTLDNELITDMENAGIDASGEEGEYHTIVTNGPIFHHKVIIKTKELISRDGYHFLDISSTF